VEKVGQALQELIRVRTTAPDGFFRGTFDKLNIEFLPGVVGHPSASWEREV
jgi:hypothetical protein